MENHQSPKDRPPYLRPSQRDDFDKKVRGACHCGQTVFWMNRDEPLTAKYCHCSDCKTIHGAPFQWAAIIHKADMAFEHGTEGLHFYNAGRKEMGYNLPCKVGCASCKTLIMDEGRNMVLLFPTLLQMPPEELREKFCGRCHIFWPQRVVNFLDDLPKWEGLDEQSKRVG